MTWLAMDRSKVVIIVRPALFKRDDVINNGGTRPMTDMTNALVAIEDSLRAPLLLPT